MPKDRPPLMFGKKLGALRPASPAAERALEALADGSPVEIAIKRARPNQRRMALYWIVAAKAAENWPMAEGEMTDALLHRETKEHLGIGKQVKTKTGKVIFDVDSISFSDMTEDQRSAYINAAFAMWSHRLGVDVETLTSEAQQ